MSEVTGAKEAQFNQAVFQQQRLHELFTRIDRLWTDLFAESAIKGKRNYEIVFADLNSVFLTVSSQLDDREIKLLETQREFIRIITRTNSPFTKICEEKFQSSKIHLKPNFQNQDKITDELFKFRINIEDFMDRHHLSNPSKLNPTKASIT